MQEEFHGINDPRQYKLLYGWNTLNANVWLPSVSELVGIAPDNYYEPYGTYYSAMQGLNLSVNAWTDAKGGAQFVFFQQYNASGGGEAIMSACNQQASWLRSSVFHYENRANSFNSNGVGHTSVTNSRAVHPAVCRHRALGGRLLYKFMFLFRACEQAAVNNHIPGGTY